MQNERFLAYENMDEGERKKIAIEAGHDIVFMIRKQDMFMSREPANENLTVEQVIEATRKVISREVKAMQLWQTHQTYNESKGIESEKGSLGNPERNVDLANKIAMKYETLLSYLVTVPDKNVDFQKVLDQWKGKN